MSSAKRSRAAAHVLPIDAGRKDRTTPHKPTPPVPAPLLPCLKVKVVIGLDKEGRPQPPIWAEVANYPAEGGLEAFYELIHRYPDDSFMTSDARGSISFASIVAIRRPKDDGEEFPVMVTLSPPGTPQRRYQRLRTRIGLGRGEVIDVANVPWTEDGIAHFGRLVGKHRRCDFITTDFGFMPLRGILPEDLIMPGAPPAPKTERLRPEDMLRPEDFPE